MKTLKYSERGCVFRMGRFLRVAGPGTVRLFPIIDLLQVVNLDETIQDWRHLCPEELDRMVKFLALNYPELPKSLTIKEVRESMEMKSFTG